MELRALFLLPLCFPGLQSQSPETQRRREGDTLYIQCPYTEQTEIWYPKYWLFQTDRGEQDVVNTNYENRKQSIDGRTKIKDDSTNKTVSITMTDLKAEDSGTYLCVAYKGYYTGGRETLRTISLNVFKEVLRWELDTLSVQCPSRSGVGWCRKGQSGCTVLVDRPTSSRQSKMKSLQDRASITYNAQGVPVVTMKQLQPRDSGVYWCALGPQRSRAMEVVLSVFKRSQQLRPEVSGNISVQCHYRTADFGNVTKAWCKREEGEKCTVLASTRSEPPAEHSRARAGLSIQDDPWQGVVTVSMERLQPQDAGVYWCALLQRSGLSRMEEVTLSLAHDVPPGGLTDNEGKSQGNLLGDSPEPSPSENTFIVLTVVLLILLLLALVTAVALGVRHYRLLERTGNREAEDTSDRPEGTAQPGCSGRRESSLDASKGPAYTNLEMQSQPSLEDPLYCNVELSQAGRDPQHVEYAVIAFSQPPRNGRE